MSFAFFGTFTLAQWNSLKAFGEIQKTDLARRKKFLDAQRERVGIFSIKYGNGNLFPTSISANGGSYANKLLQAYRILGGNPERDLIIRNFEDPVFLEKGRTLVIDRGREIGGESTTYSDGTRDRGNIRFDRTLGLKIQAFKDWQLEVIKRKREHLEYKIKRVLDYSDQLKQESDLLGILLGSDIDEGSVEDLIRKIEIDIFSGRFNVVTSGLAAEDHTGKSITPIGTRGEKPEPIV
jgi:hypothetical protein